MEAINRAIAADPDDDYVYYLKSRIYIAEGSLKKAEKEIDTAIAMNPQRPDYYGVKATVKLDKNDPEEAIRLAEKGLEADPENLLCNNVLSMAHSRTGRKDDAIERIEHMLSGDPENAFTHANAGFHYLRQGNIPKAKEHFSVALQIDPNQEYAKSGMAEAIKSTNFLYRKLLQFAFWIERIGNKNKWIMYIGIIILIRIIPILVPFYLVFILWTWFTPPIANILLYFDKYGRYLLDEQERHLTRINMGLLVTSLGSLIASFFMGLDFLGLSFAFFVTMLPVYHLHDEKKGKKFLLGGFAVLFLGLGIAAWFTGFVLGHQASALIWGALLLLSVLYTWVT